jgi:hypothetical protein
MPLRYVSNNQCQGDFAPLRHQDIVGSACRLIVHAFDADAAAGEGGNQLWMNETLPLSGAEYYDIRAGRIDLLEMRRRKVIE